MSASNPKPRAIGGYFELEAGVTRTELYPGAIAVQSARSAFLLLLGAVKPSRVWLPWYICESMTEQACQADIPVVRYGLDESFGISDAVEIKPGDCLLYVNYFGLCDANVKKVLSRYPRKQVVIDNSQALFAKASECLATIYSPRKFVGVPDGGYLLASGVEPPGVEDDGSVGRCIPLLMRLGGLPEDGFAGHLDAEEALSGQVPKSMSALTHRLLRAIDYHSVASIRKANYETLHDSLSQQNGLHLQRDDAVVPLSYPFVGGSPSLRNALIANRVYAPRYWPQLIKTGSPVPEFERFLANDCIPLPCDQRCAPEDLARVVGLVKTDFGA